MDAAYELSPHVSHVTEMGWRECTDTNHRKIDSGLIKGKIGSLVWAVTLLLSGTLLLF